jgi:hypothetical protein
MHSAKIAHLLVCSILLTATACDKESERSCVTGMQVRCACVGSAEGIQRCGDDGTFGECECDQASGGRGGSTGRGSDAAAGEVAPDGEGAGSKASGGGAGGNRSTGSAGGKSAPTSRIDPDSPSSVPEHTLSQGNDTLIGVFAVEPGIVIVLSTGVRVVDRQGGEVMRWDAPRPLLAAAVDGTLLGVADGAKVTALDLAADLTMVSSTDSREACASAVMIGENRLVCGPVTDWDRIFYIYDVKEGKLLANSDKYTYNGRPMRRVPGRDAFVTVSDTSSPSDFHLYSVSADNKVTYMGESPYHGDFQVTNTYAFDGEPPTHVVTETGILLDFSRSDCGQTTMGSNAFMNCFVKDGALGTVTGTQGYVGMSNQGGTLYGLLDPELTASAKSKGERKFLLQSIDMAAREVKTQKMYMLDVARVIALVFDSHSSKVVIAYNVQGNVSQVDTLTNFSTMLPYRVDLLPLN